jgi:transmembrane sensor
MSDSEPREMPRREGQLDEEAAHWFARMRGPDADALRPEFERWLARGALHRRAYNRAGEVWSMGRFLIDAPVSQADMARNPVPPARAGRSRLARDHTVPAILLAGSIAGLLIAGWQFAPPGLETARPPAETAAAPPAAGRAAGGPMALVTIAGERRTITLDDGSTVVLRPQSRLSIRFDAAGRNLRLEQGAARFVVAHEPRPFVVYAGGGTITAHGTVFDVALDDKRVSVRLLRGSVAVALLPPGERGAAAIPARWLTPGEQMDYALPASAPRMTEVAPASPMLEFDDVRLADLAAQANRGSTIVLKVDPDIADLRISGRFQIADTGRLADTIGTMFHLKATSPVPDEILLRRREPKL